VPIRLAIASREGDVAPAFQVIEARLDMGISEYFELRLVVQHADPAIRLDGLLRREAEVLFDAEPHVPSLRGILRRASVVSVEPSGLSRYELRIVPLLFLLHRRRNHRIFSHRTPVEMLETLLSEHATNAAHVSPLLTDPHPGRAYTVQYGETDLAFIDRILADEGIVYLFDFAREGGQLVLVDDTAKQSFRIEEPLPFVPPAQLDLSVPAVYEFWPNVETGWAKATVRDYDYTHPLFDIEATASAPTAEVNPALDHYEFEVGEVRTQAQADKRARDILDSYAHRATWAGCRSTVLLAPGSSFSIDGCARGETAKPLLVCWTHSTWKADLDTGRFSLSHDLTCIPAANTYKQRRLEKPAIPGVQTGVVVGAPGLEIDVDENGEVEVELRWDREATHAAQNRRRMRVSQAWAGSGHGLVTFPRVGDEVVVAYLDGDPDQPLIVGRVHNPTRPNPLMTPEQKTVSTWRSKSSPGGHGFNEIAMDDLAGKERIDIHAQRDFRQIVEHDADIVVKNDLRSTIHGDKTSHTVGKGDASFQQGFSLTTPAIGVVSAQTLIVNAGNRTDQTLGEYIHDAGTETHNTTATHKIVCTDFVVEASASISLTCGGSTIKLENGRITITSAGPVEVHGAPINLNC
jgi:type VI secretion system secreted protein VgrG